jgi:hypothetical protein
MADSDQSYGVLSTRPEYIVRSGYEVAERTAPDYKNKLAINYFLGTSKSFVPLAFGRSTVML